jgi:alpha-ribazole phosphatase/probable phosphoglycerate mutase
MIRHGEIPSNVNKVYAGRSPEPLTERGVRQAKEVSDELKKYNVGALYSSPIQRALQTAQIISEGIGMDLMAEDAFREIEMGPWEGMSEKDIAEKNPEEWDLWNRNPAELKLAGRETLDDLLQRVLTGVRRIPREMAGQNVVIVTHVAIIRVLMLWCSRKSLNLYKTIHVPNAEIFEIDLDGCPSL